MVDQPHDGREKRQKAVERFALHKQSHHLFICTHYVLFHQRKEMVLRHLKDSRSHSYFLLSLYTRPMGCQYKKNSANRFGALVKYAISLSFRKRYSERSFYVSFISLHENEHSAVGEPNHTTPHSTHYARKWRATHATCFM